ncbi:hypothetical protein QYE76_033233 [Lolium multiflorum]|uniref:Uncharacterized protein n=1 Tax=Lolium multiflorum TaxID=4521 RepID=A0AAD8VLX8_LOLMU|nr:hypothetical protein QYE76_033233 [Lolium multiflorum]
MTYYVVFEGRVSGVYEEWEDCKKHVHKFSDNCYKGYPTKHEAVAKWMKHQPNKRKMKTFAVLSLLLTIVAAGAAGPHHRHGALRLFRLRFLLRSSPFAGPSVAVIRDIPIAERVPLKLSTTAANFFRGRRTLGCSSASMISLITSTAPSTSSPCRTTPSGSPSTPPSSAGSTRPSPTTSFAPSSATATPPTRWAKITGLFTDNKIQRVTFHQQEFFGTHQNDLSLDDYALKLKSLSDELRDLEFPIDDKIMLSTLSAGLGEDLTTPPPTSRSSPRPPSSRPATAPRAPPPHHLGLGRPTAARLLAAPETPRPAPRLAPWVRRRVSRRPPPGQTGPWTGRSGHRAARPAPGTLRPGRPGPPTDRAAGSSGGSRRGRRRRGGGGGGTGGANAAARASSPDTAPPPWTAGHNPWTGVVHAYSMPVPRAPTRVSWGRVQPPTRRSTRRPSLPRPTPPPGRDPVGSRAPDRPPERPLCWGVWWRWRLVHGHRRLRAYGCASRGTHGDPSDAAPAPCRARRPARWPQRRPARSLASPAAAVAPVARCRARVARRAISVARSVPRDVRGVRGAPSPRRPRHRPRRPRSSSSASPPVAAVPEPMLTALALVCGDRLLATPPTSMSARRLRLLRRAGGAAYCRTRRRPFRPTSAGQTGPWPAHPARRSDRLATGPATIPPVPTSARAALRDPHWRAAMQEECTRCSAIGPGSSFPGPLAPTSSPANGSSSTSSAPTVLSSATRWVVRGVGAASTSRIRLPRLSNRARSAVLHLAASRAWPVHQMDVSNAFLHGHLQEQAPRAWYQRIAGFLHQLGFRSTRSDASLFVYRTGHDMAYLLLYVDDIILAASTAGLLRQLTDRLRAEFALKDLGPLHYFLGIEVVRRADGFFLHRRKYAHELLERAGCLTATPPYSPKAKLSGDGSLASDAPLYRSIVGALQYLTLTRPELHMTCSRCACICMLLGMLIGPR